VGKKVLVAWMSACGHICSFRYQTDFQLEIAELKGARGLVGGENPLKEPDDCYRGCYSSIGGFRAFGDGCCH
jgi:hypothetical protein